MSLEYKEKLKKSAVRTEPLDKIYAEVASQMGLKTVAEKDKQWIKADGLEYSDIDGKKCIIPKGKDENRKESVGFYCKNNGKISFIDENGRLYVAPSTPQREKALKDAGYKQGGIFVPFSNGERPTDDKIHKKLLKMESKQMSLYEKERSEEFKEYAKKIGIKTISSRSEGWLKVSGVEYKYAGSDKKDTVPKKRDPTLLNNVGTYCTNNGIIAFVNEKGEIYAAPYKLVRENELREAGYKKGGFPVPFSNGEEPTKKSVAYQLDKMREKTHTLKSMREESEELDIHKDLDMAENPANMDLFKKKRVRK